MNKKFEGYGVVPTSLLAPDIEFHVGPEEEENDKKKASILEETFKSFGISTKVIGIVHGNSVTRFELKAETGIKVLKISALHDELMIALAAYSLRIEAPVPGKDSFYIELPNDRRVPVTLRGMVETDQFLNSSPLVVPFGRDISGEPIYYDISKTLHLLIAGSTGSGTVSCINTILTSILLHSSPDDVRMILLDPTYFELCLYKDIPHLLVPVINGFFEAVAALKWAITEKKRRQKILADGQVKDINEYKEKYRDKPNVEHLSNIIIVISELSEFMFPRPWARKFEEYITRLAIDSGAAGIYLIVATHHPSVSVLAGAKKVIGSSIAFAVTNCVDSRKIIDSHGAEQLIGKGDMLFFPVTSPSPIRSQGVFVSDSEVESVVGYINNKYGANYDNYVINELSSFYESINRNTFGYEQGSEEELNY